MRQTHNYNERVLIRELHPWNLSIPAAIEIQKRLSELVQKEGIIRDVKLVSGFDVSVNRVKEARAAAVTLSYPEMEIVEKVTVRGKAEFPYIPGLLSFREVPLVLEACRKLKLKPDLIMVDGQGIAHPRRFGLACHLGMLLDLPSIGCAKSLLTGFYAEVGENPGSYSEIHGENGEVIGAAVRTRRGSKPLIISIGHKISLSKAIEWVLKCCIDYRLPEPTRLAHLASRSTD